MGITLPRPAPARTEVKKMRVKVHPGSIKICVPAHTMNGSAELRPIAAGNR